MKRNLSVLIPVFNYVCTGLVEEICRQAAKLGIDFEVVVAEDGSTNEHTLQANAAIAAMAHCRYLKRTVNVGRARIRNVLARESRFDWLLFLDCDMVVNGDHFLQHYVECEAKEVADGGFGVVRNDGLLHRNLRYTYEWTERERHSAKHRQENPHRSFRTTNFLIRRDLMLKHPFDERFLHYGYEDVLFGKQLKAAGIAITHIDNMMMLADVEDNATFMAKTEEGLRTLHQFSNELRGYSRLLTFVEGLHVGAVRWLLRSWHRLFGGMERRNLCGRRPSMRLFKLYKVGYFMILRYTAL